MAETELDRLVSPATCPMTFDIESIPTIIPARLFVTELTFLLILETETDMEANVSSTRAS